MRGMGVLHRLDDAGLNSFQWGEGGKVHTFETAEQADSSFRKAVAEGLSRGETDGMTAQERSVAVRLGQGVGIHKAADTGGAMFAWYPWDGDADADEDDALAEQLATVYTGPGATAKEDLHLTVLYLAEAAQAAELDPALLFAIGKLYTQRSCIPEGKISGIGRFVGDGDTDVIVALVDCVGLGEYRRWLQDELLCRNAVPWNSPMASPTHGFVPHITLGYVPKATPTPVWPFAALPFKMDDLTLAIAGDTFNFELGGDHAWANVSDSPMPFYAARMVETAKAGRVLSGKHLTALQEARVALDAVIAAEEARRLKEPDEATAKNADADVTYITDLTKASDEMRYTLGPLYAPNRKDAHGEWTDDDTLHKAVIDFMQERFDAGDNRLTLQHDTYGEVYCGRIVECMRWPYDHTIKVAVPGNAERELEMPAGTVYMGVVWDEAAWPLVKDRKLTGFSLGGKAIRVATPDVVLPSMGDSKLAAASTGGKGWADGGKGHDFVSESGGEGTSGKCATCEMSYGAGAHHGNAGDPKAKTEKSDTRELLRRAAAEHQALEEREDALRKAELETLQELRSQREEDRGMMKSLFDAVRTVVTRSAEPSAPVEHHVHLGSTEFAPQVVIHEPAITVEPAAVTVERAAPGEPPVVNVEVVAAGTSPGATRTRVTERDARGLVVESETRPVD